MVGDEIGFGFFSHQFFAPVEWHLQDDFVQVLVQANEELFLDLQRGRAVRGALDHVGHDERELANGVVGDARFWHRLIRGSDVRLLHPRRWRELLRVHGET